MTMVDFLYKKLFQKILFKMDPEDAHNIAIFFLKIFSQINLDLSPKKSKPFEFMGIRFKNQIGIAAGFDKNAEVFRALGNLGFGFVEVGSVTLRPQKGNSKPRVFRIINEKSIINHFGLNNYGAYEVLKNIEKVNKRNLVLGINIAKNNDVDFNDAHKNIADCYKILKDVGDFFVINISCPNVGMFEEDISNYIRKIIEEVKGISDKKPLFIKISPDLSDCDIKNIVDVCVNMKCGIVAANTSKRRDIIKDEKFKKIEGGASGICLRDLSLSILKKIRSYSSDIPVISVGGIFDKNDIEERRKLGVFLFEIYTSFIYEGPGIIEKLLID